MFAASVDSVDKHTEEENVHNGGNNSGKESQDTDFSPSIGDVSVRSSSPSSHTAPPGTNGHSKQNGTEAYKHSEHGNIHASGGLPSKPKDSCEHAGRKSVQPIDTRGVNETLAVATMAVGGPFSSLHDEQRGHGGIDHASTNFGAQGPERDAEGPTVSADAFSTPNSAQLGSSSTFSTPTMSRSGESARSSSSTSQNGNFQDTTPQADKSVTSFVETINTSKFTNTLHTSESSTAETCHVTHRDCTGLEQEMLHTAPVGHDVNFSPATSQALDSQVLASLSPPQAWEGCSQNDVSQAVTQTPQQSQVQTSTNIGFPCNLSLFAQPTGLYGNAGGAYNISSMNNHIFYPSQALPSTNTPTTCTSLSLPPLILHASQKQDAIPFGENIQESLELNSTACNLNSSAPQVSTEMPNISSRAHNDYSLVPTQTALDEQSMSAVSTKVPTIGPTDATSTPDFENANAALSSNPIPHNNYRTLATRDLSGMTHPYDVSAQSTTEKHQVIYSSLAAQSAPQETRIQPYTSSSSSSSKVANQVSLTSNPQSVMVLDLSTSTSVMAPQPGDTVSWHALLCNMIIQGCNSFNASLEPVQKLCHA